MLHTSNYTPLDIPIRSLARDILLQCKNYGNKIALIDGTNPHSKPLTYYQTYEMIVKIGNNLVDHFQFEKKQVFAILLPNLPIYPIIFQAIGYIGGINTTLNPTYSEEEIRDQLVDSNASFIVTLNVFLDKTIKACKGTNIKTIFVVNNNNNATTGLMNGREEEELLKNIIEKKQCKATIESFDKALLKEPKSMELIPERITSPKEDLLALPYSSGTTGKSKGVMLTHYNLYANILQCDCLPSSDNDILLGFLPFFHIYGLTLITNRALLRGLTLVTMAKFDLERMLQLIQEYKITVAYIAPPVCLALAKHPIVDKYNISTLNNVTCGAAPLSKEIAELASKRINCTIIQGYGLTEASPVLTICDKESSKKDASSVGSLLANTELKVVDVDSNEILSGFNKRGELCFRGPQIMKGYLNNIEATKETVDKDGFLCTGDIGYITESGNIFIVDRKKELIKYKGYQVPPAELEGILLKHPKIQDCAVIGIPVSEQYGEIPKAYVKLNANEKLTEEEVMNYVAQHVAHYRRVRAVEFVDEIPKSPSGKILRRVLKQQALQNKQFYSSL
ncbi:hypothetical protein ABK040_001322 [Willaertia magna]